MVGSDYFRSSANFSYDEQWMPGFVNIYFYSFGGSIFTLIHAMGCRFFVTVCVFDFE